jgi:hypothetical protein
MNTAYTALGNGCYQATFTVPADLNTGSNYQLRFSRRFADVDEYVEYETSPHFTVYSVDDARKMTDAIEKKKRKEQAAKKDAAIKLGLDAIKKKMFGVNAQDDGNPKNDEQEQAVYMMQIRNLLSS